MSFTLMMKLGKHTLKSIQFTHSEIDEFFSDSLILEYQRQDGSFIAVGKLKSGRFLEVTYRKKSNDLIFIITAYDLQDKEIINWLVEENENYQ